jgi:hypothetical protein
MSTSRELMFALFHLLSLRTVLVACSPIIMLFSRFLALAVGSASSLPQCNVSAAFVVGSSVVAVFNSSTSCVFPLFPYLAAPSGSVGIIAVGGGGGGGSNGGGGGGAGGVVTQTMNISTGQAISIVVGSGGSPGAFNTVPPATQGQSTSVAFSGNGSTGVTAFGGGFGGSRNYGFQYSVGGSGGSGGGGGGGGCPTIPGGVCNAGDTSGGGGTAAQGSEGGLGFQPGADAGCDSAGAGGGGSGAVGTAGAPCSAGNGGNGYQLPFAPILSLWVAGGGAGALTCYESCSNPPFGTNGLGQISYGGGGQAGCGNGVTTPSSCNGQSGKSGAVFLNFSFVCPAGSRQVVLSGFFSGSPCELCTPGNFSSAAGSASCATCPAGKFSNVSGASACTACAAGTYNPSQGSSTPSACELCLPGTFNSASGSTSSSACTRCAPGTFSSAAGSASCATCPAGKFSNVSGASACTACAAGTYNPSQGSSTPSACELCPSGFFCSDGASQPSECPSGSQAGQGATDVSQCTAIAARQLLSATVAVSIACVFLADLVHACFFVKRNAMKVANSKPWILACLMFGPLVWPMWWCRQRALSKANADTPLRTLGWTESMGSDLQTPASAAHSLESSQHFNPTGFGHSPIS